MLLQSSWTLLDAGLGRPVLVLGHAAHKGRAGAWPHLVKQGPGDQLKELLRHPTCSNTATMLLQAHVCTLFCYVKDCSLKSINSRLSHCSPAVEWANKHRVSTKCNTATAV